MIFINSDLNYNYSNSIQFTPGFGYLREGVHYIYIL